MLIRDAVLTDIPHVLPMVKAICALHESHDPQRFKVLPDVVERYASWLPERITDPRSLFVVAQRDDGSLAGYVVGTVEPEIPIFWVPECGWIHDVWVDPGDRRHGVGRSLIDAAIERFKAMGVKQLRMHTGVFNDKARAMFGEAGFRPSVIEMLRPM
jgi:GNAT superfamily N-acetyltransferase